MLFALDTDRVLYVFESIAEAESYLEAIDIKHGEYRFCDHTGQRFHPVIGIPISTFHAGTFHLEADDTTDAAALVGILTESKTLARGIHGYASMDQLRAAFPAIH